MYADFILCECTATVECCRCAMAETKSGETEGEAVRLLEKTLERTGWRDTGGKLYCPQCVLKLGLT